ncbi:hypothetical protein Alsa3_CDS0143 [Staphylococcus phage Alsa_3]|nr:hypothetical protein Alsa3_CDS0143 [Staphylococcus phage Alsa_3]WNM51268.1 hypothetical protein Alsa4_CDS0138 [Staphylococcus phage Alsa_4]
MKNLTIIKEYTYGNGFKAYEFELSNGNRGVFRNSSSNEKETRYTLEIEGEPAGMWGTMLDGVGLSYTRFNGTEEVYEELLETFGVPCESNQI